MEKALDPALAQAIANRLQEAECWPQGDQAMQFPSDANRAAQGDWTAFRNANPTVVGALSVEAPVVFRRSPTEEVAAILADSRCADTCGGLWLIVLQRKAAKWTRVSVHNLLNY
jgi:hypothetical protein